MGVALALEADRDEGQHEDHIVVLRNVSWADYERIDALREDKAVPRLHYAEGVLEIMSPSNEHEQRASRIGCLVEVYCLEAGIDFETLGSWTLKDEALKRGVEADECYVFGPAREATRPDLAIEVVWRSGGLGKLATYRALRVREVWYWRRGIITPYVLRDDAYVAAERSEALPGIDLAQLASFLDHPTTSAAIRAYRDALRGTR